MSKVILFSRVFPEYHPRKGDPTFFVEKFLNSVYTDFGQELNKHLYECKDKIGLHIMKILDFNPKGHTIRAGKRWKVGEKFSPRVWGSNINPKSGRSGPYHSDQLIIAPDVTIVKLWDIEIDINGVISINGKYVDEGTEKRLAKNDGLSEIDFFYWLIKPCMKRGKPFSGQIICWDNTINYS